MKHMLTIAAAALLACGPATAGDCGCDPCSSGKKWSFGGGLFSKKSCGGCNDCATPVVQNDCGCDDPCKKKFKFSGFKLFGNKGCNDCDSCDPCAKKLSLPKINFFKRGCGCDTGCDTGCGGCGSSGTIVHSAPVSGGVIVHPAPAGTQLAPVPGAPAVKPAPAPAPVPVPAGS